LFKRRKLPRTFFISGALVADAKTKQLCKRIQPGQIALITHEDVDDIAAETLIDARVGAVINTRPFLTGNFPAAGAKRLLAAGIPMFEVAEPFTPSLTAVDGLQVAINLGEQRLERAADGWPICPLEQVTRAKIEEQWKKAQNQIEATLSRFIDNTLMYASQEKDLFLKPLPKLPLHTRMENRHVVVVVRGQHYRQDLRTLASYIHEYKPVLIAVDGGADALQQQGLVPDLIIGDMDSATDTALTSGAEIIVHAYPDGTAPGRKRVEELGLPYHILPAPGTSEDVAMLLAYEEHAKLIVTIGTHNHMIDFLEKGRKGMASTLLVRTKIGTRLIDAKGVSQLYQPRLSWHMWLLVCASFLAPVIAILSINPVTRHVVNMLWMQLKTAL